MLMLMNQSPLINITKVIAYTELTEGGLTSPTTMTGLLEVWYDLWENVLP